MPETSAPTTWPTSSRLRTACATPSYNLGNGGDWAANAAAHGVVVNNVPTVGAVAEWNGGEPGLPPPGHVAVVEAVGPHDSYIVISQQHIAVDPGGYDWMQIDAGSQSWEPWPDHFIHFLPYKTTAGVAPTPDDAGYWLAETDGEVSHYGDAGFFGDAGNLRLKAPISGIADGPQWWGLLARWLGRRHLQLRRRRVLRFDRRPAPQRADRRHRRDARRKGLLARWLGRRHLRLR